MERNKIILGIFALTLSAYGMSFKEGTYAGEAKGYRGDIKVEVKVSSDKIEEIRILENGDTPILSDSAIKRVAENVLKYQSTRVDGVAGATGTSKAAQMAIRNALKSSGVDAKELNRKVKTEEVRTLMKKELKENVVVIGAGGAGLVSAIEAKLNGAEKVVVLEKMAFAGGNTLISGGEYAAPNN